MLSQQFGDVALRMHSSGFVARAPHLLHDLAGGEWHVRACEDNREILQDHVRGRMFELLVQDVVVRELHLTLLLGEVFERIGDKGEGGLQAVWPNSEYLGELLAQPPACNGVEHQQAGYRQHGNRCTKNDAPIQPQKELHECLSTLSAQPEREPTAQASDDNVRVVFGVIASCYRQLSPGFATGAIARKILVLGEGTMSLDEVDDHA